MNYNNNYPKKWLYYYCTNKDPQQNYEYQLKYKNGMHCKNWFIQLYEQYTIIYLELIT